MAFFDLSLSELEQYRPEITEPEDFVEFWTNTLAANPPSLAPVGIARTSQHLQMIEVFDLQIQGFGGQPVSCWYIRPKGATAPLPTVVSYVGYGGGRGFPEEHLSWVAAGFAHVIMDTRGQGATWGAGGSTSDDAVMGPAVPGWMTKGILDRNDYYYRRLYTDAANTLVTVRGLEGVDPQRILVSGASQGGGLATVAATLDLLRGEDVEPLAGLIANVPFLSHFERAVGLTDQYPYQEIVDYLSTKREDKSLVFKTLQYFDAVNFAKRARIPALFSVGLMDGVTPPSTVFAVHNWYPGEKQINVYEFNGHDGGGAVQARREIAWAQKVAGLLEVADC